MRIAGLDRVPAAPMPRASGVARPVLTERQRRVRRARRALAGRGLVEAVTWSFIPRAAAQAFGGGADALELANPISTEMSSMRPSLLPGLLAPCKRNRNRGFADVALFEVGQAYRGDGARGPVHRRRRRARRHRASSRAAAATGTALRRGRRCSMPRPTLSALLAALGFDPAKAQITRDAPAWYHPGRSGALRLGPKIVLAHFGEVHPATLKALDVAAPVAAFEIFLDAVPAAESARAAPSRRSMPPISCPCAATSPSCSMPPSRPATWCSAAQAADKTLIASVACSTYSRAAPAGEGKKSLAIEVTLQPTTETLTDQEIEAVAQKIIAAVKTATGGEIRG